MRWGAVFVWLGYHGRGPLLELLGERLRARRRMADGCEGKLELQELPCLWAEEEIAPREKEARD